MSLVNRQRKPAEPPGGGVAIIDFMQHTICLEGFPSYQCPSQVSAPPAKGFFCAPKGVAATMRAGVAPNLARSVGPQKRLAGWRGVRSRWPARAPSGSIPDSIPGSRRGSRFPQIGVCLSGGVRSRSGRKPPPIGSGSLPRKRASYVLPEPPSSRRARSPPAEGHHRRWLGRPNPERIFGWVDHAQTRH